MGSNPTPSVKDILRLHPSGWGLFVQILFHADCFLVVEKIYNEAWTVLTDHNDWGALVFSGILTSTDLSIMREVIVEDDVEDIITPAGEHSDPIDPLAPTQIPTRRPGNK